jgi:hypothetical protein
MTQDVVPANQWSGMDSGLGDIEASDLRMPRLSIDKDTGTWQSSMGQEKFEYITAIPLGVVKQRVLWQPNMSDDNVGPMCKSPNAKEGYPTLKGKNEELFPWQASGFNPGDFPLNPDGRAVVPCTSCRLASWGSHPDGKKAWCSEQWTIPVIYGAEDDEPQISALLTAQRSSLAGAKSFFAGLYQRQKPGFAFKVKIGLIAQTRGKNKYYVPTWSIIGGTDEEEWPVYSNSYVAFREYVARPPRGDEAAVDATTVAASNVVQGQFTQQTWAPGTPAQPVQPAQPVPTAQPMPQPQPAAQQPVMQPTPAQAVPLQPPINMTARDDDLPF